jgi:hypothetical protein
MDEKHECVSDEYEDDSPVTCMHVDPKPTQESLSYLPSDFNIIYFKDKCSHPIPDQPPTLFTYSPCIIWRGTYGSRDHSRSKSMYNDGKKNGTMRFVFKKREYAARTVAFAYYRSSEMPLLGPHEKLRIGSQCNVYNCVNPWHLVLNRRVARTRIPKKQSMEKMVKGDRPTWKL